MSSNLVSEFLAREQDDLGELHSTLGVEETSEENSPEMSNQPEIPNEPEIPDKPHESSFTNGYERTNPIIPAQEPAILIQWRKDFETQLKDKEEKEQKAKAALEANAKSQLEEWYKTYKKNLEDITKETKKESKPIFNDIPVEELTSGVKLFKGQPPVKDDAQTWNTVSSLCSFNVGFHLYLNASFSECKVQTKGNGKNAFNSPWNENLKLPFIQAFQTLVFELYCHRLIELLIQYNYPSVIWDVLDELISTF
ncbi:hypothetical protein Ciccas_011137 [Cichlidogyrus casuarinus]|uniref:Clathrin light chain n=1 Tax=Cichlidogyrus casuarinus TaxID=1844966 RepID=A0ABD2PSX7_9PLAT